MVDVEYIGVRKVDGEWRAILTLDSGYRLSYKLGGENSGLSESELKLALAELYDRKVLERLGYGRPINFPERASEFIALQNVINCDCGRINGVYLSSNGFMAVYYYSDGTGILLDVCKSLEEAAIVYNNYLMEQGIDKDKLNV